MAGRTGLEMSGTIAGSHARRSARPNGRNVATSNTVNRQEGLRSGLVRSGLVRSVGQRDGSGATIGVVRDGVPVGVLAPAEAVRPASS